MSGGSGTDDAAATIAKLEQEVQALRLRLEQNFAATCICDALTEAVLVDELAAPAGHSELLEMILETAAGVISARAGGLFLIDEAAGDLVCEAAIGGSAEQVKAIRVPLGHGIAGGVALSGLPLAVTHASSDPRWAKDVGERVGYVPDSIVCVPLFYEDSVIGSLELLDKEGAPSFSPADLHALSLFAHQAAVTIEQSRARLNAGALLASALGEQGVEGAVAQQLRGFGTLIDRDPSFRASLELARLVREVVQAGDRERQACSDILRNFTEYVRARPS
jgi:GAF domain-containing protein